MNFLSAKCITLGHFLYRIHRWEQGLFRLQNFALSPRPRRSLNVFNFNRILILYNLRDLLRYDNDSIDDQTISKRGVRGSKFATELRAGQTFLSTLYMPYTKYT